MKCEIVWLKTTNKMSDNRRVLVAKRKNERSKFTNQGDKNKPGDSNFKKGIKRPVPPSTTPKKNLANDRMKRIRTQLNEDVRNTTRNVSIANVQRSQPSRPKTSNNARKRPQIVNQQVPTKRVSKTCTSVSESSVLNKPSSSTSSGFTFKQEVTLQRSIFSTTTPNPFPVSSLYQSTVADDNEDMEWSTIDSQSTTPNIFGASSSTTCNTTFNKLPSRSNNKDLFIVVDTNIFISQLQLIKNIIEMSIAGSKKPVIFIPWIVIEELDFIKEDSNKNSLKWKAQEAVKYIEKSLSTRNGRLMGQTLTEVNEQKDTGRSQDNKIIACCLQVQEKYQNMILLTNDINLKNKAHINQVPVCSHNEIMTKISRGINQTKAQIILEKMTSLCCIVIRSCAENSYGLACDKMEICRSTPKSLQECISVFRKYWFPVFQEVLMKQFKKSIDDLYTFLGKNTNIKDSSNEINELLRLCVRVCLFLKDVECCKSTIENTIRDLNDIKAS